MAIIPRNMAKEEGRKAGAAMYIPQLNIRRRRVLRPITGPNFTTTALIMKTKGHFLITRQTYQCQCLLTNIRGLNVSEIAESRACVSMNPCVYMLPCYHTRGQVRIIVYIMYL